MNSLSTDVLLGWADIADIHIKDRSDRQEIISKLRTHYVTNNQGGTDQ